MGTGQKNNNAPHQSIRRKGRAWVAAALLLLGLGVPAAAQIRPVERTFELALPLREGPFYLGDLVTRIEPDGTVSVAADPFLDLAGRVLAADALAAIEARVPPDRRLAPEHLETTGVALVYDPALVELRLELPVEARERQELIVRTIRPPEPSPLAEDPATLSGYLNLRGGVDVVSKRDRGGRGLESALVDLEAAARAFQLVVEADGTVDIDDSRARRRSTRLVYDDVDRVLRWRAGDLRVPVTGFQASRDTAGLQIERSYRDLQPGRVTRPLGRTSFSLDRPATVDLIVNGRQVRQFRLQPGNYDVLDFPLTTGANEVELVIEDEAGVIEVLTFDLFFTGVLLEEGLDELALSVGIANPLRDGRPDYQTDRPQASGFYRRGLTPSLTMGANAQLDEDVRQGGIEAVLASPLGATSLDAAYSHARGVGSGWAVEVDHSIILGLGIDQTRRSLRLSAEARSRRFAALGQAEPRNPFALDLAASYSQALPWQLSGSVTGRYAFAREDERDRWSVGGNLSRSFGPWSLGLSVAYDKGGTEEGFNAFLSGTYRFAPRQQARASYETRRERARVSYSQFGGDGIGAWSLSAEAVREPDDFSIDVGAGLITNRAELNASHDTRFADLGERMTDQRTRLRAGTALVFADGAVGIGRPVRNSFAIVRPHPNLEGRRVFLNPGPDGDMARSDLLGPAVAHNLSAYGNNRLIYDVDDLPLGYDLGAGLFELFPPYRSGYNLTIGSDYTVTVLGTLLDARGEPVALLTGTAVELAAPEREPVPVFTNRVGRFGAQGLAPGAWRIRMSTTPPTEFELLVPEGTVGLFRAGELRPAGG